MSNKAYFEQEILDRASELNSMDDAVSIGSLTLSAYASAARAAMFSQHLVQSLIPCNPESPSVSTGYEYMYGKYSTGYKTADGNLKIIKKIDKHHNHAYTLLTYNEDTKEYGIIERREVNNLGECFGHVWINDKIDSYEQGDIIPKDEVLYRSPSIDEFGNYRYGINAKVVYVISQETIEDAVVVSESFAKRASTMFVDSCLCTVNDNDIPLNIYGDNENYKSFPDIGEKMKRGILFATRRKDKMTDIYSMKNNNLRKTFESDDVYQFPNNYYVADIDIWCNKSIEEIPDIPANSQLLKYLTRLTRYYTDIFEEFGRIISTKGTKYTQEFSRLYAKARDFLDPACKYVEEDKIFSNIKLEFTLYKKHKLETGCKICGRYGNKSVVSKILPDSEMGITEDGIIPDVRIDALGVVGRLNSGQCIEQELNWIADEVVRRMKKHNDDRDKQFDILFEFLDIASPNESRELKKYIKSMSSKQKDEFIDNIFKDRIYIIQSPMYPITGDGLNKLYNKFKPKMTTIYYNNEFGEHLPAARKVIVGDEYILRLKQEPLTKFSVRSKSMINPRTSMPIKSNKYANHKSCYADQANRFGEQETSVAMLSNDLGAMSYFIRINSTSIEGRRQSDLYEKPAIDGYEIDISSDSTRSVDMLNAYFKSMGYAIVIEYEDGSLNTDNLFHIGKSNFHLSESEFNMTPEECADECGLPNDGVLPDYIMEDMDEDY